MSRYIGNYLRVPSSEPQQSSAPGIWSINEQLSYQRANVWPPARDPYYNQTVLHLSGDVVGTRETNPVTQPRTFLSDASPNNFLLTPNGDVSARPFSPYLENYSGYAPGNCYVDIASNSGFNLSDNANFTIEFWINCPATSGALWIASGWQNTSNLSWSLSWRSNNAIEFYGRQSSGGAGTIYYVNNSGDNTVLPNTWTHYAVVRNSSTISVYVNGNLINTGTINGTPAPSTNCRFFGDSLNGSQLTGYISNFRFSRSAVYTQPFTPATQPLTTTSQGASNVVFLGFNKNRFVDVANNLAFTFTSGNPAISANSPFVSLDTTSGSGYFNGSTNYLAVADSAAWDFGTGQFMMEAAVYFNATTLPQTFIAQLDGLPGNGMYFRVTSNGLEFGFGDGSGSVVYAAALTIVSGTWYHFVVTRDSGNTLRLFSNGVLLGSSASFTKNLTGSTADLWLGRHQIVNWYLNGYMANVRISKGSIPTAYQTSSTTVGATIFTPPSSAITTTSQGATAGDIQLLTLQTRAPANNQGIIDSSPNNFVVTRTGNVAQGSFSPFSSTGWSVAVNGGSGYISYANNSNWNLGADFCVEAFVYLSSGTDTNRSIVSRHAYGVDAQWEFIISSNNKVCFVFWNQAVNLAQSLESDSTVNLGQWYHVAGGIVGSSIFVCLNGVYKSTALTVTPGTSYSKAIHIGTNLTTNQYQMTGYISDVRIVRGSPVYTANYTVPTGPLTAITNTQLLTCQGRNFKDYSNNNLTATINGTASIQPFYRLQPTQAYVASQLGGSAYFDGSDYLSIASDQRLSWGTGDYTVEAWIYLTTAQSRIMITSGVGNFAFLTNSSRQLIVGRVGTDELIASELVPLNCWVHIAATRASNTTRIFMNGISVATPTSITTNYGQNTTLIGGDPSNNLVGYMSGFRAIKGTALYTSNFIPPTTPLTSVPGTSLLLNFTNSGIVDATAKNVLETVGNAQISKTQSKWGGGSILFDGTADALRIPDDEKENLRFGAGNFTIEFWAWKSANGSMNYDTVISIGSTGSYNGGFSVELSATRGFCFIYDNVVQIQSNFNPNDSTWNHYAVVRDSSTFALYKNGSRLTTATLTPTLGITGTAYVGSGALTDNSFNGYINDLRVTKGFARYTGTTYTMPAAPFPLA